jgi:glucose-1-phosphate thymidylyltransferase
MEEILSWGWAMKGIILAGGTGKRMRPLTLIDNKHLLPVYNKRMIEYPLATLVSAGIDDIILITGGQRAGDFLELLKTGQAYGVKRLYYTYQEGSGGIADALKMAEPFLGRYEPCVVILGDNYFEDGVKAQLRTWMDIGMKGAGILLKQTPNPWEFGIAEVVDGKVISLEEKPANPKSDLAVLGCYFFDSSVWNFVNQVEPSARGELEITDVLRFYMDSGNLHPHTYEGYWSDMGSFESWTTVSQRVTKLVSFTYS